jgi:hypothetical protein
MDELDPAVLAVLRQDIAAVDMSRPNKMADLMAKGGSHMMIMANVNRHEERREMQDALRAAMGGFGYRCRALDPAMPDSEIQRRFFLRSVSTYCRQWRLERAKRPSWRGG